MVLRQNVGNRCFENVAQFRYLGTTVIHQNLVQEEIKRRPNSGDVCYHSARNFGLLVCCIKTEKLEYTKL
jgi:hypothetical protein